MSGITTTVSSEFRDLIEETFSKVAGHYLDRGTSLLETLSPLSAERVSRRASNDETIAAHVFHLIFYLDVVTEYALGTRTGKTDWAPSWAVKEVGDQEWAELLQRLGESQTRLEAACPWDWTDPEKFGGMVSMLMHTSFHLGALRQILDSTNATPLRERGGA